MLPELVNVVFQLICIPIHDGEKWEVFELGNKNRKIIFHGKKESAIEDWFRTFGRYMNESNCKTEYVEQVHERGQGRRLLWK